MFDSPALWEVQGPTGGSFLLDPTVGGSILIAPAYIASGERSPELIAAQLVSDEARARSGQPVILPPALVAALLRRAGHLGLLMTDVPESEGGLGLGVTASMLVGAACAARAELALAWAAHTGPGTLPLVAYGTREQKARYLPRLLSGEWVAASTPGEPRAANGGPRRGISAARNDDGRSYSLNGTAGRVANAGFADLFTVVARVGGEMPTAFLVERCLPGVSTGRGEEGGGRDRTASDKLALDGVVLPASNVLGRIGQGQEIAAAMLNVGRLKLGCLAAWAARECLGSAVRAAAERRGRKGSRTLLARVQPAIGELAARIYAAESVSYCTAGLVDAWTASVDGGGGDRALRVIEGIGEYALEAAIVKAVGTEVLCSAVRQSRELLGGPQPAYTDPYIQGMLVGDSRCERLLAPSILLSRTASRRLPLLDLADREHAGSSGWRGNLLCSSEGPLASEQQVTELAKLAVAHAARHLLGSHGAGAPDSAGLDLLADLLIEAYALDCTVARTWGLMRQRGVEKVKFEQDLTAVFTAGARRRIEAAARRLLSRNGAGSDLERILGLLDHPAPGRAPALTRARARIAEQVGLVAPC